MQKLTPEEVQVSLAMLDGWQTDGSTIWKDYVFQDFRAAMSFMNKVAETAEQLNHHPDWSNSYNKVTLRLTSHDSGGLTDQDFVLARAADTAAHTLIAD
ncbi:MAG TPA: 4a-hydroxytetrahydrobiopterin dehydratase [Candidatus Saccharimonadales bacterium]|nr:4a-hydroxytetrahydrobiopterin dehydratase [Candidatus Saccharimonadales bacterium]